MTATFEAVHPRDQAGLFDRKNHSYPEFGFGAFADRPSAVTDYADGASLTTLKPLSTEEVNDALDAEKGEPGERVRLVRIQEPMAILEEANVHGPLDGRPLLIDVTSGAGSVIIHGGYVVIRLDSPFPNEVEIRGDADVTVIVARGRAALIRASGSCTVLVITEEDARGGLRVENEAVDAQVTGPGHRFSISHPYEWTEGQ